jgi:hypothetical protein
MPQSEKIAQRRIRRAQSMRLPVLDLSGIGLEALPHSVSELSHLIRAGPERKRADRASFVSDQVRQPLHAECKQQPTHHPAPMHRRPKKPDLAGGAGERYCHAAAKHQRADQPDLPGTER